MSDFDQEARAILRYILSNEPSPKLLKRYVKAISLVDGAEPMGLSSMLLSWPALLRFVDPPFAARGPRQTKLRTRLNIGLTLCETCLEGVHCLRQRPGESRAERLSAAARALVLDALTMPGRLLIWRLW